jgi:pyruvate/2-oxoacid:ferredoxin oxidoreductase beta subunit
MKAGLNKIFQIGLLVIGVIFLSVLSACTQENKDPNHKSMNMEKKQIKSAIVHSGIIDLVMIDENKDDMVYQDQMDWNVISDKAGKCPLCGMVLKEVTLNKAKENLVKNGFEVK